MNCLFLFMFPIPAKKNLLHLIVFAAYFCICVYDKYRNLPGILILPHNSRSGCGFCFLMFLYLFISGFVVFYVIFVCFLLLHCFTFFHTCTCSCRLRPTIVVALYLLWVLSHQKTQGAKVHLLGDSKYPHHPGYLVVKVTTSWGLETCSTILMSYFCLMTKGQLEVSWQTFEFQ